MIRVFKFRWLETGTYVTIDDRWAGKIRQWVHIRGSAGMIVSRRALWIGAHYSTYNKRLCINLLPCVTLWATLPGGNEP